MDEVRLESMDPTVLSRSMQFVQLEKAFAGRHEEYCSEL